MMTGRCLLLIFLMILGVAACEDEKPLPRTQPVSGATQPSSSPQVVEQPQSPPPQPTSNLPWPPPAEDGNTPLVAENLLTRNYFVILDSSGSMADSKCSGRLSKSEAAKVALSHFVQAVPPDTNLGLAIFDGSGISERVPLGLQNREQFMAQVKLSKPGNGTPLHNAVVLGYQKMEEQGRRQLGYGEYHLVIVTDGEANEGQDPTSAVNFIVSHTPVVMHTIGFCIGTDHSLNQPGRTIYKAADDPEALRRGLEEVLAESPGFDVTDFR